MAWFWCEFGDTEVDQVAQGFCPTKSSPQCPRAIVNDNLYIIFFLQISIGHFLTHSNLEMEKKSWNILHRINMCRFMNDCMLQRSGHMTMRYNGYKFIQHICLMNEWKNLHVEDQANLADLQTSLHMPHQWMPANCYK